jgi:hypothetical protein
MSRLSQLAFGIGDLFSAALVALGVFVGLPARWWPVDAGAAVLIGVLAAAGCGLVWRAPWAATVARLAAAVALVLGLALVATLALTASYLAGIYGPVGRGGALILVLVAALALPYLVILPSVQLVWFRRGP